MSAGRADDPAPPPRPSGAPPAAPREPPGSVPPLPVAPAIDAGTGALGLPDAAGAAAAVGEPLSLAREVARKAIHLASVAVPVAYALGLPRAVVVAALLLLLALALVIELVRTRSARARAYFTRTTGALLRAHEHHQVSGATWLLVAFLASTLLFERSAAIAAMCAVSLGDAAAAVIGRWLGRRRLGARKSLEGSVACFAATYLAARTIAALGPGESLVAAAAATAAEWPERPLDDNLRMAIATGAGILLWRLAFS